MKTIALLSSCSFESDMIRRKLKNVQISRVAGKQTVRGELSGLDCHLINTGIGKVNAAHSATALHERFDLGLIINLGVGGGYPGANLKIGEIAVAMNEINGDEGVAASGGIKSMKAIGIPLLQRGRKKFFNEFPLHQKLIPGKSSFKKSSKPLSVKKGNFVTVSAATGTDKRARNLEKKFDAICENMEGSAIAQVCAMYKTSMIEIRGISNIVGIRDKRRWNLKLASENCQQFVLELLDEIVGHEK